MLGLNFRVIVITWPHVSGSIVKQTSQVQHYKERGSGQEVCKVSWMQEGV